MSRRRVKTHERASLDTIRNGADEVVRPGFDVNVEVEFTPGGELSTLEALDGAYLTVRSQILAALPDESEDDQ